MKSLWLNENIIENFSELKENLETEICIIGGGIFGISTAYYLSKHRYKVVLLEKDKIASKIQIFKITDNAPTAVPPILFIEESIGKLNTKFKTICKIQQINLTTRNIAIKLIPFIINIVTVFDACDICSDVVTLEIIAP